MISSPHFATRAERMSVLFSPILFSCPILHSFPNISHRFPTGKCSQLWIDTIRNHLMRKMAIFSAVIFLAIASLLLCSCSGANQGQGPSYQSRHSKISGSGAVEY